MAERSKAHAWKACWGQPLAGSNPAPSATCLQVLDGRKMAAEQWFNDRLLHALATHARCGHDGISWGWLGKLDGGRLNCQRWDCLEQPLTIAEIEAEFLEIGFGEIVQDIGGDTILMECLGVVP